MQIEIYVHIKIIIFISTYFNNSITQIFIIQKKQSILFNFYQKSKKEKMCIL